jgi:methyl-accepting chemotaxis protein
MPAHPADQDRAPGSALVADDMMTTLLRRWLALSELDRRAFLALARELNHSADLIETSTLDLSDRFRNLADIARGQMARVEDIIVLAQSIDLDGEALPMDAAMRMVDDLLLKIIDRILSVSKQAMRMVYALDDVMRDVSAAEQSATRIDAINTRIRDLALNAAIEASRSGADGFDVIAHEMRDLSRQTEETSRLVRARIHSVANGVRNGHKVLQQIATLDMSEHIMAKERLDALVRGMIGQNRAFNDALQATAGSSGEMSATISKMITGMQFQDRAKQQFDQVIAALGVLGEANVELQQVTLAACPGMVALGEIDPRWLNRLLEKQTLGEVRQRVLARLLAEGELTDAEIVDVATGGDMELF